MSDVQNPPEGMDTSGVVHDVNEALELPPEPPPTGPVVWIQENLISGATPTARVLNGALSVIFFLLSMYTLQFITSFIFAPERRWGAATVNMKLMMVQAFPNDDMERIWISLIIFGVLVAWTLASSGAGGRISVHKLAGASRAVGIFLMITAVLHGAHDADGFTIPPLPTLDLPSSWSGVRFTTFLIGLALTVIGFATLRIYGRRAKDVDIPFLMVFPVGMALVLIVLNVIELPFPDGQFTESPAPIESTTRMGWFWVFSVTVVAYFVGKLLRQRSPDLFRRIVITLWVFSYPIIVMIVQRNPILIWDEIFSLSWDAPLGALLISAIVGAVVVYWMAAPNTGEEVRIAGFVLVLASVGAFFVPLAFMWRVLIVMFALVAVASPSFGGTKPGQRRMVIIWVLTAILIVVAFVLGRADTALVFQGTAFLGGFNLTILLAITGLVLSFPLGVVLGLARRSTMPIFRLLATGYIELVRSVPLITWLFFGSVMFVLFLPQGVEFDEIVLVVMAIAIFSAAYVAEQVRGGLQSIPKGQYEAARAMGLTTVQSMSLIILPQAIRAVIPSLVGSIIVSFKDTSLVAIIGLADLLLIARSFVPTQSNPFNFQGLTFQMLFFVACFYWLVTFTFSRLALRYEKKLGLGER